MILILTATYAELNALELPENCVSHVCGMGGAVAGVETFWAINHYKPQLVVMVGIAGRYEHAGLKVGDSVLVKTEVTDDCGAFYGEEFRPTMRQKFECPYIKDSDFLVVNSSSVNVCSAPFLHTDTDIENMEGAAFFAAALKCGVPFLQLRTVSNTVSVQRKDWDRDLAFKNMNLALKKLLYALED